MNKKFIFNIIRIILKPFAVLYFWINRWIVHSKFQYELNNNVFGKPSLISYPFIFLYKITLKICDLFFFEFGNYALSKYKNFLKVHYSEKGIAYSHFKNINHEQKKQFYLNGRSRLEYFYNNNQYLLHFKNGDSFLDIACGYGSDIRFLSDNFDKSEIFGFDINPLALEIIKIGNQNSNVNVMSKSFIDFNFLNELKSGRYDWVLICHAFSVVFESDLEKTLNLKRKLIKEFIRISNKGLLILDHPQEKKFRVQLEQNSRCSIFHNYIELFPSRHQGELYMMESNESFAYFWKKNI